MLMFYWTSEQAVLYHSISSFVGSGLGILVQLGYIFVKVFRRFLCLIHFDAMPVFSESVNEWLASVVFSLFSDST